MWITTFKKTEKMRTNLTQEAAVIDKLAYNDNYPGLIAACHSLTFSVTKSCLKLLKT